MIMKNTRLIITGFFLYLVSTVWAKTPNVIIIMTDDQGYGDLSCHGNPILKTPNLDLLHSESVRFTDFHVSPFCTPTRAALMTGNHPGVTGAYRTSAGRTMLHPSEKTIANHFAENGYKTGMTGKWHLGDNAPHRPQDRGFQDAVWHRCGGVGQASDYWGNDYFDDTYERVRPGSREGTFEKFNGYCTDVWFREGMRFIAENKNNPFLLYIATNAPHGPYRVDPKWAEPYKRKDVNNANFFGMIANIDHNLGLLRDHLKDLNLDENTILIFMTDNGTSAGCKFPGLDAQPTLGFNAGMRGRKSSIYEGGHRVPFFLHWPAGGYSKGRDIETLAAHIDVLPTLADLCKLPKPDKRYDLDGLSLSPLLTGKTNSWKRNHLFLQYHGGAHHKFELGPFTNSVVMTEKWRLVNTDRAQELYDIQIDPSQRNNIASQRPEIVNNLRTAYQSFWQRVSPGLKPVAIDIGDLTENPSVLCSQDWRPETGNPPWNFSSIKKIPKVTHPWLVNILEAGKYRFTLRQWPKEADKPIVGVKAKIKIAGVEKEALIKDGSKEIDFTLSLPSGITELWTYIYNQQGQVGGAYFTEVEKL
jgi:arylsulfatase A-like enzyme